MKILLTGATGFIGKELCKSLVRKGHVLHLLVRNPEKAKLELPFPHQAFKWKDVSELPPKNAFENCEVVIHLAGEPIAGKRWSQAQKNKILNSRVESTKNLIAALKQYKNHQVKRALLASAIGYYGDRADEVLMENSKPSEGFLSEICQKWEAASAEIKSCNISSATIRVGVVLGSQGGMLKEILPLFTKGIAGVLGNGKQWLSWIHLQDIINIFTFLLEEKSDFEGVVNAAAPLPITNKELTQTLSSIVQKSNFIPVPALALKLALGEMSILMLGSARAVSSALQKLGFQFQFKDLKSALEDVWSREKNDEEFLAEQWIDQPIEKIFSFFAEAKNLEIITPPWLNFQILGMNTKKIEAGSLINYQLKIHGIPARWTSSIGDFSPPTLFTDTQKKGPYKKWFHTHRFEQLGNGTLISDRVLYQIPFGFLGSVAAGALVKKDLREVFAYRQKKIAELFGA